MRRRFRRRAVDADLSEELQAHLELLTDRHVEQGLARDEARAAATRQLGNVTRVREDVREINGIRVVAASIRCWPCGTNSRPPPRLRRGRRFRYTVVSDDDPKANAQACQTWRGGRSSVGTRYGSFNDRQLARHGMTVGGFFVSAYRPIGP
jgi:hypothetical protein